MKIQVKRGVKANLPALSEGELAFCTDTGELYVGGESKNIPVKGVDCVPVAGGTMTGDLTVGSSQIQTNGYIIGTWLRTTQVGKAAADTGKVAVIDNGWIYYRTPQEIVAACESFDGGDF